MKCSGTVFTGLTSSLAFLQDEQRAEMHRAEGGRALVDGGQERVGHVGRLLGDHRVGAVERHVGDHAEEAGAAAACDDVAAHGQILQTLVAVQLDLQPLGQRSADDHAELVGAFSDGAEGRAFLGGGGEGVEFGVGSEKVIHERVPLAAERRMGWSFGLARVQRPGRLTRIN